MEGHLSPRRQMTEGMTNLLCPAAQKSMRLARGVDVPTDNFAFRIDPSGSCCNGAREIYRSVSAVSSQESVGLPCGIPKIADHMARGIDVPGLRDIAAGHIEGRKVAVLHHEAVSQPSHHVGKKAHDSASIWCRSIVH